MFHVYRYIHHISKYVIFAFILFFIYYIFSFNASWHWTIVDANHVNEDRNLNKGYITYERHQKTQKWQKKSIVCTDKSDNLDESLVKRIKSLKRKTKLSREEHLKALKSEAISCTHRLPDAIIIGAKKCGTRKKDIIYSFFNCLMLYF